MGRRRAAGGKPHDEGVPGVATDMDVLCTQLRLLRELAGDAKRAEDGEQVYDFSVRWGAALHGRLQRLFHYAGRGALSPEEQTRFAVLQEELRDAGPLAQRLGLAAPSALFTASGTPRPAARSRYGAEDTAGGRR